MSEAENTDSTPEEQKPERFSKLRAMAAAAAILAVVQGILLVLRQQSFDAQLALGMGRLGVFSGILTVLVVAPVALLVGRWLSGRGDPARPFRSLVIGFAVAVSVWMVVRHWLTGPFVPAEIAPWLASAIALAAGYLAFRHVPSRRATRRLAWVLPAALALALLPGGTPRVDAGGPKGEPGRPARPPEGPLPDLVLVSIDTLRADRLGAYGMTPTLTPEIDRLAAEGFVFERALAASPWTVPSVASMLTGLPTVRHGAGLPLSSGPTFVRTALADSYVSLAEHLSNAGYRTHAVVANAFLSPIMGMAQGFDSFDTPLNRAVGAIFFADIPLARLLLTLFPVEGWADYRAAGVTDKALAVLAEEDDAPLFLWVHYIDPHTPYMADPSVMNLDAWAAEVQQRQPEVLDDGTIVGEVFAGTSHVRGGNLWLGPEDRRRLGEYYDRAVTYVDGEVGRLFDELRRRRDRREVIGAVTADHGEELWDHGHFEHGHDFYREVTRVPLLFWGPGTVTPGRASDTVAGLVDMTPTLLDLAGFELRQAAAPDEGRSLAGHLFAPADGTVEKAAAPTAAAVTSDAPAERFVRFSGGNLYGLPAVLLEDESWRFILRANGVMELYDVVADPLERRNLAADEPLLAEQFRALLEPRLAVFLQNAAENATALDPETLKALQSLGYVQ